MRNTGMVILLGFILSVCVVSCGKVTLNSDKEKYSCALGHIIGENYKRQEVDIDIDAFKAGLSEGLRGVDELQTPAERNAAIKIISDMVNKKVAEQKAAQESQQTPNTKKPGGVK